MAIACILTDGHENSSQEHTREQIFELIRDHRDKGWEFVFLAANQDAFKTAESLAIDRGSVLGFAGDGASIRTGYTGMTNIVSWLRRSGRGRGTS
jgi:hypothetical protein